MTQLCGRYNEPLLHKDSYEPVSMMECHKGFERRSIEMFSFVLPWFNRKNSMTQKLPVGDSPPPSVINFRFGCPKITGSYCFNSNFGINKDAKYSAPKNIGGSGLFSKTKTPRVFSRYLCLFEEAFGGIRICKLQVCVRALHMEISDQNILQNVVWF